MLGSLAEAMQKSTMINGGIPTSRAQRIETLTSMRKSVATSQSSRSLPDYHA